ncbi:MAG: exodeoxyribonuclease VII large subunit [Paracoccus sp. (in: a-proteobacteria)]|nr:exodeoxyribonuclease VII large subunit [Paracoccus sp. (in: a-proteobacteria)]
MDLIDDDAPGSNAHEFTVSEISGAVKRVIEDQFGRVRVRGEIGRVARPASGHLYFDLKDDRAVIAAITWKGQAARLSQRPEEGMEVVATGRMTTFPGQSKYQLIVDEIEPAGAGALMAMLERRRRALAAEGLFDDAKKRALPFLPEVIGVVTSPSGAVIRDILHRLRERFPSRVVIWPVAVQGAACAPEVAAAIDGFNALSPGGEVPRPDLLIVARGGGSIEDLWGFNEEIVVRAAARSRIPLISAVGHETDTTLIDFAADRRAPTPTAAAEMAVPVRRDLALRISDSGGRMTRALVGRAGLAAQRLRDLGRALGRPAALTTDARQRFDLVGPRLEPGLAGLSLRKRARLDALPLPGAMLRQFTRAAARDFASLGARLGPLGAPRIAQMGQRVADYGPRLEAARGRVLAQAKRDLAQSRARLGGLAGRLDGIGARGITPWRERLERVDRLRVSLGYEQTLKRGFAVLRDGKGHVLTTAAEAGAEARFEVVMQDGSLQARPDTDRQGSLF